MELKKSKDSQIDNNKAFILSHQDFSHPSGLKFEPAENIEFNAEWKERDEEEILIKTLTDDIPEEDFITGNYVLIRDTSINYSSGKINKHSFIHVLDEMKSIILEVKEGYEDAYMYMDRWTLEISVGDRFLREGIKNWEEGLAYLYQYYENKVDELLEKGIKEIFEGNKKLVINQKLEEYVNEQIEKSTVISLQPVHLPKDPGLIKYPAPFFIEKSGGEKKSAEGSLEIDKAAVVPEKAEEKKETSLIPDERYLPGPHIKPTVIKEFKETQIKSQIKTEKVKEEINERIYPAGVIPSSQTAVSEEKVEQIRGERSRMAFTPKSVRGPAGKAEPEKQLPGKEDTLRKSHMETITGKTGIRRPGGIQGRKKEQIDLIDESQTAIERDEEKVNKITMRRPAGLKRRSKRDI